MASFSWLHIVYRKQSAIPLFRLYLMISGISYYGLRKQVLLSAKKLPAD